MDKENKGVEGFTFGCDPELFVLNREGRAVSAEGLIPGDKQSPYKVPNGAVQVDGMAAEVNTDPADNFEDFNGNLNSVLKSLKSFLPKGYTLSVVPSIRFDEREFEEAPDKAKMLGCDPDFNAWTGEVNPPPNMQEDPFLRTASGHLHIGWKSKDHPDFDLGDIQHILNCRDLTKQLDWFLAAWSLRFDKDAERRKLYGKAGAYRPKPYGVEYRVLSNFWLTSLDRRKQVWDRMQEAIRKMTKNFAPDNVPMHHNDLMIEAINASVRNSSLEQVYKYPLVTLDPMYARF